jgi:AraC-like DNA-binding protein/mannose-6-phosphate isomerase-like protein (cupin superfamily)
MPQTRQTIAGLNQNWAQLEALPQVIVAYGHDLAAGETLAFHHHRRAQLVYASQGVMTVTTGSAAYVVPPQRAVWMPAEVEHRIDAHHAVAMRTLYIEPSVAERFPAEPCVLQVTALLRELIITAVAAGNVYTADSPQARLTQVILDQISTQPVAALILPLPEDQRLRRVTQALMKEASDSRNLDQWAREVGASKRTLNRLFTGQTGMSFRAWRQQRRLLRALELLATGESVTSIGLELGYQNSSAFIAMFRRCLGTTPTRYLQAPD